MVTAPTLDQSQVATCVRIGICAIEAFNIEAPTLTRRPFRLPTPSQIRRPPPSMQAAWSAEWHGSSQRCRTNDARSSSTSSRQ